MRDPAVTQDAPTVDRAERHRAPNRERTGSRVLAPQVGCLPTGTSSEEAAMKDAPAEPTGTTTGPAELPTNPPNGRTAGVDWAKDDHVVAVVDSTGTAIDRFTVPHTGTGLAELTRHLAQAGCAEVAIERPDGPVVAELLEAGLTVVVISPNQLNNLRSRYGSAGNKDDRFDAYVLADTLRTDRARLRPLVPDSPATVTLRGTCRARQDLVGHRVALANQLRAHLQTALPAAVGLFADLDSPISLRFRHRFDTQDKLDWLSPKRLAAWLASVGYCGRVDPAAVADRGQPGRQPLGREPVQLVLGVEPVPEAQADRAIQVGEQSDRGGQGGLQVRAQLVGQRHPVPDQVLASPAGPAQGHRGGAVWDQRPQPGPVGAQRVGREQGRPVPGAQVLQLVRADDHDGQPGLEQFGDDRSVRSFDRHLGAASLGEVASQLSQP